MNSEANPLVKQLIKQNEIKSANNAHLKEIYECILKIMVKSQIKLPIIF